MKIALMATCLADAMFPQAAIATVRLGETAAAERHAKMAALYSARALDLLDDG